MSWRDRLLTFLNQGFVRKTSVPPARGYRKLVIILDGTLSTMTPGCETNAGLAAKLLRDQAEEDVVVYYEAGLQWRDWTDTRRIITGKGINGQIRRAYGWLASNYRPGDRIYLMGYSRGAYAVRSLAGIIGRIGLLERDKATERHLRDIYRLYAAPERVDAAAAFAKAHCYPETQIECVAVWDTVKALGIRLPLIWMLMGRLHRFHDHELGDNVRAGYHALAYNERRMAYEPVLWETRPGWRGELEQVWFKGTHADVGGQLGGRHFARPLANIPFVWLLEKVERSGIALPRDWQDQFPRDPDAPSIGQWTGWGRLFWNRWPRKVGRDPSESIHPTALDHGKTEPSALPTNGQASASAS
ncbi:MAG: DUF2235 domain-containing protein [Pseudomonadota bacterium]